MESRCKSSLFDSLLQVLELWNMWLSCTASWKMGPGVKLNRCICLCLNNAHLHRNVLSSGPVSLKKKWSIYLKFFFNRIGKQRILTEATRKHCFHLPLCSMQIIWESFLITDDIIEHKYSEYFHSKIFSVALHGAYIILICYNMPSIISLTCASSSVFFSGCNFPC